SDDDRGRNWPPHTRYRSWLPCFKNAWCKGTRPACPYLRQNRLLCGKKTQNHSNLLGPSPGCKFSTIPATLPSHHIKHQWWPVDHFSIGTGSSPHGARVSPSTSQHKRDNPPPRQRCDRLRDQTIHHPLRTTLSCAGRPQQRRKRHHSLQSRENTSPSILSPNWRLLLHGTVARQSNVMGIHPLHVTNTDSVRDSPELHKPKQRRDDHLGRLLQITRLVRLSGDRPDPEERDQGHHFSAEKRVKVARHKRTLQVIWPRRPTLLSEATRISAV